MRNCESSGVGVGSSNVGMSPLRGSYADTHAPALSPSTLPRCTQADSLIVSQPANSAARSAGLRQAPQHRLQLAEGSIGPHPADARTPTQKSVRKSDEHAWSTKPQVPAQAHEIQQRTPQKPSPSSAQDGLVRLQKAIDHRCNREVRFQPKTTLPTHLTSSLRF